MLSGRNWNNASKAGITNRNSNNDATNSNRNFGSQLELRIFHCEEDVLNSIPVHSARRNTLLSLSEASIKRERLTLSSLLLS